MSTHIISEVDPPKFASVSMIERIKDVLLLQLLKIIRRFYIFEINIEITFNFEKFNERGKVLSLARASRHLFNSLFSKHFERCQGKIDISVL